MSTRIIWTLMPLAFRSARALSSTSQMSVSGRRPFGSLRVSACAGPFKGYAVPPSEMKNGFPLAHQRALIDAKRPDLAGPEIRSRDHAVGAYRATAVLEFAGGGYHGREQQHEPDQCTRSRAGSASSSTIRLHLVPPYAPLDRRASHLLSLPPRTRARMNCTPPPRPSDDRKGDANPRTAAGLPAELLSPPRPARAWSPIRICVSEARRGRPGQTPRPSVPRATTWAPSTSKSSILARSVSCGSVPRSAPRPDHVTRSEGEACRRRSARSSAKFPPGGAR